MERHRTRHARLFDHTTRDPAEYRDDRLEAERQRLERRLSWAVRQGDAGKVERLTQRLADLDDAMDADLAAGCPANRFEPFRE